MDLKKISLLLLMCISGNLCHSDSENSMMMSLFPSSRQQYGIICIEALIKIEISSFLQVYYNRTNLNLKQLLLREIFFIEAQYELKEALLI